MLRKFTGPYVTLAETMETVRTLTLAISFYDENPSEPEPWAGFLCYCYERLRRIRRYLKRVRCGERKPFIPRAELNQWIQSFIPLCKTTERLPREDQTNIVVDLERAYALPAYKKKKAKGRKRKKQPFTIQSMDTKAA